MVSLVLEGYDGVITYASQRREASGLPSRYSLPCSQPACRHHVFARWRLQPHRSGLSSCHAFPAAHVPRSDIPVQQHFQHDCLYPQHYGPKTRHTPSYRDGHYASLCLAHPGLCIIDYVNEP